MSVIGLLHPGEMGSGIGGSLVRAGHEVLWSAQGRSEATRERADAAGLSALSGVPEVLELAEVVLSICPPHAAIDVAKEVAAFRGTFVDLNAIAPEHAETVATIVEGGGAHYVDGAIIGSPPPSDVPRMYLAGSDAERVASLFSDEVTVTLLTDAGRFPASSLKMAYAAWTKGSAALILDVRAMARANGVEHLLVEEWSAHRPQLIKDALRAARQAKARGWRWSGEMAEIASTFRSVGLPTGFHVAAEEIYQRAPRNPNNAVIDEATLDEVLDALLASEPE